MYALQFCKLSLFLSVNVLKCEPNPARLSSAGWGETEPEQDQAKLNGAENRPVPKLKPKLKLIPSPSPSLSPSLAELSQANPKRTQATPSSNQVESNWTEPSKTQICHLSQLEKELNQN
jgi:hypothetical protein